MRVYLTMEEDGKAGTITGFEPILKQPAGTDRVSVYARPGDWLLWRHVCVEGIKALTAEEPPEPLTPTQYDLTADRLV